MPSEGRHSWHSRAHPPPLSSPGRVTLSDNRLRAGRTDRGMDLAARNKETAKIHSCNSSLSSLFRHKRRMEQVELSGRITGRLGYTRRPEPTPSEGRQRWHNDTLSSPQSPPPALFLRDDCGPPGLLGMGTAAASAGAAGPSQELRAGWSSGRTEAGVHRGERTTHLRERADDRDSEPDYLLRPTRHGPGDL